MDLMQFVDGRNNILFWFLVLIGVTFILVGKATRSVSDYDSYFWYMVDCTKYSFLFTLPALGIVIYQFTLK